MNHKVTRILIAGGTAVSLLIPGIAAAFDVSVTGFIRQEIAVSVSKSENRYNQSTDPWVGKVIPAPTWLGGNPAVFSPTSPDIALPGGGFGAWGAATAAPFTCKGTFGVACGDPTGATSAALDGDMPFNMFNTRAEIDISATFSRTLAGYMKIRAYFDATSTFADARIQDLFGHDFYSSDRANLLEWNSPSSMVDLPAFYLDWHKGPWWLRAGNQQIAWGEALFFRVFDVVNGLDLRRHLFLDVAAEEYADERVASPGLRVSYTFSNGWEFDGFVQMFNPTILPNTNNPYNVIDSAFTVLEKEGFDDAENALNFGFRVIAPLTDNLTLQAMAVDRRNPDGIFAWTDAPRTNPNGTPNPFCAGPNNAVGLSTAAGAAMGILPGQCGAAFTLDQAGTSAAYEWSDNGSAARLNWIEGVATGIDPFPAARFAARGVFGLGLPGVDIGLGPGVGLGLLPYAREDTQLRALNTLDAFFTGFGPLRGYISRKYKREQIFGFGGNYIFTAEPGSLLDQLVVRGEMSYTPDKKFTSITLDPLNAIEEDEYTASIVLEKYQRFWTGFPATFIVLEYMFKSESDLFGRHLSGNEGDGAFEDPDGFPDGQDSFNAVAFAFQQPFPNLIWRADFAMLIDVEGGFFVQPGVRYRHSKNWQWGLYANIISGGGGNDDIMDTLEWADEVFLRATYFF